MHAERGKRVHGSLGGARCSRGLAGDGAMTQPVCIPTERLCTGRWGLSVGGWYNMRRACFIETLVASL